MKRPSLCMFLCLTLLAAWAAGCRSLSRDQLAGPGPPAPQVLAPTATAAEIVAVVNANTARVQSLLAGSVSLALSDMPNLPLLSGTLSAERPRRLRLRAGSSVTGPELDLGSNDELFWFWVRRSQPPAQYVARHDQFAGSAAQNWLPIPPEWLLDAVGMVQLNPAIPYQGPFPRADGTLELRSIENGPAGTFQRVIAVEPTRGWVTEQNLYSEAGELLATATGRKFRYDPAAQASLPMEVTIRVPRAELAFSLDLANVTLNQPISDPAAVYGLPTFEGYPQIDLGRTAAPAVPVAPQNTTGQLQVPAGYLQQAPGVQSAPGGGYPLDPAAASQPNWNPLQGSPAPQLPGGVAPMTQMAPPLGTGATNAAPQGIPLVGQALDDTQLR